jgi:hypothetical protein
MGGDPRSAALAQRQAQEHAARQRVHQAQLAQQAQQRLAQQRLAQQRLAQQRLAHQRQAQQRQAQQRQAQQRQALQRQAQRLRVWRSTAAKRAARQVETELAIEQRQERQRAYAAHVADELLIAAVAAPLKVGRLALRRRYMQAPVDVGDLERPLEPPRRRRIKPLHWSRAGRERRAAEADSAYQAAIEAYEQAEFDRVRQLSTAKRDHQRSQAEAADRLWAGYQAGERDAVATYAVVVLSSRAPNRAGSPWQVNYEPSDRLLSVEYELPADARHAEVVAQFALRALFDLFHTLDDALVEVISFNGLAVAGPSLVSITVTRDRWAAQSVLDHDAQTVLRTLSAPQHHAAPR